MQLSRSLLNRPVLSLRINQPIATVVAPVINPNNLKIEGFYCEERGSKKWYILLSQDVRDIIPQGFVVNDQDALSDPNELVRFKDIINLHFEVIGKHVATTSKQKIGKISDYSVDSEGLYIQKLYVTQTFLKGLASGNLSIDRSQIVEITDKTIIINDLQQKIPVGVRAVA